VHFAATRRFALDHGVRIDVALSLTLVVAFSSFLILLVVLSFLPRRRLGVLPPPFAAADVVLRL
jgi:hypothetical protein